MADAVAAQNAAAASAAPSSGQPAQAPVGEAALSKLPEKLQNLTRPVVVTGTVAGETPDGMTRVRTAAGEVLLKSPVPLPADKPVTLQIPAGSPPPKAVVLAQLPAQPQTAPPTSQPISQPANQPANAAQVILQSVANAAAAPPGAQLPPIGALISAVVLAANPKASMIATPLAAPALAPGAAAPLPAAGGKGESAGPGKAAPEGQAGGAAAPTTSGGVAGRGAAHGQPVELGGDAAHRGTMLDPPPGKSGPGLSPNPGRQGEAPPQQQQPQPGQQQPAQQQPTPRQPVVTQQGGPAGLPAPSPLPAPASPLSASPSPQAQTPPQVPQPAPGQSPTPNLGQAPPRGSAVGLTMREFAPAPGSVSPNRPPPNPSSPSPSTQAAPAQAAPAQTAQAPIAAPAGPPSLQSGQTLAFKVLAAAPPPSSPLALAPAPTSLDGAPVMEGEIAGLTPQGKPILAVKDGMLALNTDLRPPTGSRLTLQWLDPAALALEKAAPVPGGLPDFLQGRDWPALKAALAALRDLDPALVQQFLAAAMPQPNRKLGAALTFLISAMRGGDARGWLGGDAASGLQRAGKESLLAALEQEFRNVDKQTSEKLPDDWRGVTLPIYDQSGINPLHLYFHPLPDPEKPEDKPGAPKGTRFVLDVEMSRLGPLQLDGMVKPPQFDMILRSRTALPAELRDELRAIFADSLAAVGYAGGLTFKADVRGWVNLARAGSSTPGVSA